MPPPTYPPYQTPILEAASRLVTKPWQQFFLSLVAQTNVVRFIPPGSVTFPQLQTIGSPRVLGRGSVGTGPIEELTLGTGLALTGTVLSATATGGGSTWEDGYWTPITDGVTPIAELLFDSNGDCIVGFVPTP